MNTTGMSSCPRVLTVSVLTCLPHADVLLRYANLHFSDGAGNNDDTSASYRSARLPSSRPGKYPQ